MRLPTATMPPVRVRNLRNGILLLTTAALVAAVGCAPQLDRMEVEIMENRAELQKLQVQNQRLLGEVAALAQLLRMESEAGDETGAMRLAKLSQVSTRLDQLMMKLDDNAEYMRDLSARVDLLATRSGIPTLGEYRPPPQNAAPAEELPEEGRSILEAAELDRSRGNLELARSGFEEFLNKYGDSEAADDALYWLGDLAYANGEYTASLQRFEELQERFPQSERLPAALYKSRSCLLKLGRQEDAWTVGGDLLSRFPDSTEAALLREQAPGQSAE